jgi:hypothetical protein
MRRAQQADGGPASYRRGSVSPLVLGTLLILAADAAHVFYSQGRRIEGREEDAVRPQCDEGWKDRGWCAVRRLRSYRKGSKAIPLGRVAEEAGANAYV